MTARDFEIPKSTPLALASAASLAASRAVTCELGETFELGKQHLNIVTSASPLVTSASLLEASAPLLVTSAPLLVTSASLLVTTWRCVSTKK